MDTKEMKRMDEAVKKIIGYGPEELLGFDREVFLNFLKKYDNNKYGQKNSNHFKNK